MPSRSLAPRSPASAPRPRARDPRGPRRAWLLPALAGLLAAGCSGKEAGGCDDKTGCPVGQVCQGGQCAPMSGGADMATPPIDASSTVPDLTTMEQPPGIKFATNKLVLPKSRFESSIDIDGNGAVDNQLGTILGLLASQGTDFQASTDIAVKLGLTVQLFEVRPADLLDSKTATVGMRSATPRMAGDPPAYDGTDTFQPSAEPALWMTGALAAGALSSKMPRDLTAAEVKRYRLIVPIGRASLRMDLYGVHVQATTTDKGMMAGQFHGVVRKQDIDSQVIPSIADLITAEINANPQDPAVQQLIRTFETGPVSMKKCQDNMADCCKTNPKTCKITPDEVRANQLIQIILVPDLQCYDAQGSWRLTPNGVDKDCLSVGLGFTAVRASF